MASPQSTTEYQIQLKSALLDYAAANGDLYNLNSSNSIYPEVITAINNLPANLTHYSSLEPLREALADSHGNLSAEEQAFLGELEVYYQQGASDLNIAVVNPGDMLRQQMNDDLPEVSNNINQAIERYGFEEDMSLAQFKASLVDVMGEKNSIFHYEDIAGKNATTFAGYTIADLLVYYGADGGGWFGSSIVEQSLASDISYAGVIHQTPFMQDQPSFRANANEQMNDVEGRVAPVEVAQQQHHGSAFVPPIAVESRDSEHNAQQQHGEDLASDAEKAELVEFYSAVYREAYYYPQEQLGQNGAINLPTQLTPEQFQEIITGIVMKTDDFTSSEVAGIMRAARDEVGTDLQDVMPNSVRPLMDMLINAVDGADVEFTDDNAFYQLHGLNAALAEYYQFSNSYTHHHIDNHQTAEIAQAVTKEDIEGLAFNEVTCDLHDYSEPGCQSQVLPSEVNHTRGLS